MFGLALGTISITPTFEFCNKHVQNLITRFSQKIITEIVNKLIKHSKDPIKKYNFNEKFTNKNLSRDLRSSDQNVKLVYHKLFERTLGLLKKDAHLNYPPSEERTNTLQDWFDASNLLLGSFVFAKAKIIANTLQQNQPEAFDYPDIWKTSTKV